ncbi:MAG: hypothetical protein RXR20_14590 [Paraburkholderia sp.]|uniref:hypothetical protein n=1 Tax=Burkholderiaceae TaxID=119060 RepID=UPI0010F86AB0|nr:hypothetical protein [Burkholderia sp. 4M9327F10]
MSKTDDQDSPSSPIVLRLPYREATAITTTELELGCKPMKWTNRIAWLSLGLSVIACVCLLVYVVSDWTTVAGMSR